MHTRPYAQDGNRLYQPCEKEKHGKIPLPLVRQILETLQETTLFELLDEKRRWVFEPVGAWPDEVTGRFNKGAPECQCRLYNIAIRVTSRLYVHAHTVIDLVDPVSRITPPSARIIGM